MIYKVIILEANNEGEELVFEINGNKYFAMGLNREPYQIGDEIEVEIGYLQVNEIPWEALFSLNKEKVKMLKHIRGWKYEAFGQIVSIKPTTVDVGDFCLEIGELTNDERVIGEFLWFPIDRLDIF